MVFEGEVRVVDPDRTTVVRHPLETLAVARYVLQLGVDVLLDAVDVDPTVVGFQGRSIEYRNRGDMKMGTA